MSENRIKVVTGKLIPDDHRIGIVWVTQVLRDAGREGVYLGVNRTIDQVMSAVEQEDADVVGLSFSCGGHLAAMRKFMDRMRERDLGRVLVLVGGVIPAADIPKLKEIGVAQVFPSETRAQDIVDYVTGCVGRIAAPEGPPRHAHNL